MSRQSEASSPLQAAVLPPRKPLVARNSLPSDLDDVRMSQLSAVRWQVLEPHLNDDERYWLSWSKHLNALPLDLLDAWFESWVVFYVKMDRTRVTRLLPPTGPGKPDAEVEKIVQHFIEVKVSSRLSAIQRDWCYVLEESASEWSEWLELSPEAQEAWLCGPEGWYPAYRAEPAAPYRVLRLTRPDVNMTYEIGPERPDGFRVRVTDAQGVKEKTWSRESLDMMIQYYGTRSADDPPEASTSVEDGAASGLG